MKKVEISKTVYMILLVLASMFFGYCVATMKIDKCKNMTPEETFNNKTCREFYLGK